MRCFIALNLPKDVKDYLYDFQKRAKSKEAKVKWVAKKHLHLTLKFFNDVKDVNLKKLTKNLESIKLKPIKVKLSVIGVFPDEDYIRVVWVGIKPEGPIVKLAQKIDEETLDVSSKEQRFTAHLTIGRVREVKSKEKFLKHLDSLELEPLEFTFTSFSLIQSTLTSTGPIYKELKEYPLE